jgi:hypothetical protein
MEGVDEAQLLARVLRVGAAADGQFWIDLRGRGGRFQVVQRDHLRCGRLMGPGGCRAEAAEDVKL